MIQLRQAYPPATSSACVPIAAPKAPPYLEGAAVSAPPPMSHFASWYATTPIQGNVSPVRGRQSSQYHQQGIRGRSGSSESSSPSPRTPPPNVSPFNFNNSTASSGLLPVGATCRVCGGQHDESRLSTTNHESASTPRCRYILTRVVLALEIMPMRKMTPLG